MKQKKIPFFVKLKRAIVNFEEYKTFSEEKTSVAIKYALKLILIFTLMITIALTYKFIELTNAEIQYFKDNCPEFKFENNTLMLEGDSKQFIKGDENGYFGLIINSEKETLNDIEETSNYQRVIGILKNKIIIKNVEGIESSITYAELSQKYDINNMNKEAVLGLVSGNNINTIYTIFALIAFAYIYIIFLIQILFDALLLSIVGYLLSQIIGIKFKYKSIFNMSIYALTLSIILYAVYMVVNLFTGFEIKYFTVAYNAIAYIYIITAMLMMKSDLIKQEIEVAKIVEEQKKIKEEQKEKEKEKEKKEKEKENKPEEKKKDKKDKNNGKEETPEGSNA